MNANTDMESPSSMSMWSESTRSTLRVLMLDSETTWRGGQNQLALLVRGLRDRGVDTTVAAPPGAALLQCDDVRELQKWALPMRHGLDVVAAARLARHLRQHEYDVVHCHSSHAHSIAFLAMWPARLSQGDGESKKRPRLVVSRRVSFPIARRGVRALKYRGADLYLAISSNVHDVLVHGGVAPARVALVPSGVDLEHLRQRRDAQRVRNELNIPRGSTVVGTVAALTENKAVGDLVRAARSVAEQLPELRVIIVGEGPARPDLERLIAQLGLQDRVLLTGFRPDVFDIFAMLDCFVLPSRLEGLGTSIMDAHVMGIPVVATRTGGIPDLIEDGRTGLLVPPRDPDLLGGAIVRMLRDPSLRERCVGNARVRAQRYDYRNMVHNTVDAYQRIFDDEIEEPEDAT